VPGPESDDKMITKWPQWVRTLFGVPAQSPAQGGRSPNAARLAQILKLPASELPSIRMGHTYHYRPFAIPKRDGRDRHLLAPSPALKTLQQRLHRYLDFLPVHPAATAFMPGASIVRHARRHAGQAVIATVDLVDFFQSTSANRVRAFFIRQGWRGELLSTLMRLCVYRNGLPQGAPTSPCLSNLVNVDLDAALDELARRAGATYTRYGDDLAFSWSTARIPSYFKAAVQRELLLASYQVQHRKGWQVKSMADRPEITGLVLSRGERIQPSVRLSKKVRRLRWLSWLRRNDPSLRSRLRGYDGFMRLLDS
jgi:hypothetical protein